MSKLVKPEVTHLVTNSNTSFTVSKKLTVTVSSSDIEKGVPSDVKKCPIAHSLKARGFRNVNVDGSEMTFTKDKVDYTYLLPTKAEKFIEKFDSEEAVSPFTFEAKLYTLTVQ